MAEAGSNEGLEEYDQYVPPMGMHRSSLRLPFLSYSLIFSGRGRAQPRIAPPRTAPVRRASVRGAPMMRGRGGRGAPLAGSPR